MDNLRISLVQGATRWHDPDANRAYYGELIAPLREERDCASGPSQTPGNDETPTLLMSSP